MKKGVGMHKEGWQGAMRCYDVQIMRERGVWQSAVPL